MMFMGDFVIKSLIEVAIEDMKKNEWLIEDIFSAMLSHPLLKDKYGYKEIENAKTLILKNPIHVYLHHRNDNMEFPAITISEGADYEDKNLSTLGDASVCVEELDPCDIGRPIQYVVKPFTPTSYKPDTGLIRVPANTEGFNFVRAGMAIIDPETGRGFAIQEVTATGIRITAGSDMDFDKVGVIPQYQFYRARRERIITQQEYSIGCHAHGDPSKALILYYFVKYILLRYREYLFESDNFQLGTIKSMPLIKNEYFGADNVFSRFISLSGQVEEYWIKTPQRVIEALEVSSEGLFENGIDIISNEDTVEESEESENTLWKTIKE